jgi:dihydroorotase
MTQILLKKVRIVTEKEVSAPVDILIRDGIVAAIADALDAPKDAQLWSQPDAHVSAGWFDVGAQGCDPGLEHREDLHSLCAAAAAGGYTALACFPNTQPTLHSKSEIRYVRNKTAGEAVQVHPIGALSLDCAGKDLAELYDMHNAGAVAFGDGAKPVQDAGLLLRGLQYARAFNGLIINTPMHKTIAAGGQMHEGVTSTALGLKAIPALAETLMVQRDLSLLEYAEGRLLLHLVSTARSVELVRAAKKAGLPVHCSVAVANLFFEDRQMDEFDTNWKVLPPLRGPEDRAALLEGLLDGTVDFIAANHVPWDEEAKNLEFPYAEFGMSALETCFALCRSHGREALPLPQLIGKLAHAPRRVLGLPVPEIKVGEQAELSLFSPDAEWVFSEKTLRSKGRNTPFLGQKLRGKVLGLVRLGRFFD